MAKRQVYLAEANTGYWKQLAVLRDQCAKVRRPFCTIVAYTDKHSNGSFQCSQLKRFDVRGEYVARGYY